MSAQWREGALPPLSLQPMVRSQLDAVLAIEAAAYAFPWSRGNFVDSIAAGHLTRLALDARGALVGYFVAMHGAGEMHLLNITVAPAQQGRGHARVMIDALVAACREHRDESLWLEVRESNTRARAIYERIGFAPVGLRKNYYPAPHGRREDAVVMSLPIAPVPPEPPHALE